MNKKLKLTLITMLTLICLISGCVFAAPQSSPNVSRTSTTLKAWIGNSSAKAYIYYMKGSTGAMGTTGSLDVHLQRNTEYGAMLILGLSDYGKQASSVSYSSLFNETSNGLATTTGNVSGIYNIGNNEHVAAGKPDRTKNYYLYYTSSINRDEYNATSDAGWQNLKKGDAINLFSGSITTNNWLRDLNGLTYYGLTRNGFSYSVMKTYEVDYSNSEKFDYGRDTTNANARAVVTQYN